MLRTCFALASPRLQVQRVFQFPQPPGRWVLSGLREIQDLVTNLIQEVTRGRASLILWLSNSPLCGCTFCLSLCELTDVRAVSAYWLLHIVPLRTFLYKFLSDLLILILWGLYSGVELLGHPMVYPHFLGQPVRSLLEAGRCCGLHRWASVKLGREETPFLSSPHSRRGPLHCTDPLHPPLRVFPLGLENRGLGNWTGL